MRAIKTTLAECRAHMCAGTWAHACGGRGNSPEIGVILFRAPLERALAVEGGSCGGESWWQNNTVLYGTQKCPVWREDAGSPQASSALTRRLPPKCRDPDRLGHPKKSFFTNHSFPQRELLIIILHVDMRQQHKCQRESTTLRKIRVRDRVQISLVFCW